MRGGALIGLVNGLIVAYLNVTPFITTLGTMIIVYGINSSISTRGASGSRV